MLLLKYALVLIPKQHPVSPILNSIFVCISLLDLYGCITQHQLIGSAFSVNFFNVKIMFVYS